MSRSVRDNQIVWRDGPNSVFGSPSKTKASKRFQSRRSSSIGTSLDMGHGDVSQAIFSDCDAATDIS